MSITCPYCLRTSHHPKDEEEGYCGACHDWTRNKRMNEIHAIALRVLPDGREFSCVEQIFNWRLCIGSAGEQVLDDFYCYSDQVECVRAVVTWDGQGDPPGNWHRHGNSGRRREFSHEGVMTREWVA